MGRVVLALLCGVCALWCVGCDDGSVYFGQSHFGTSGWPSESVVEFTLRDVDTSLVYDVDFVLEHGDEYPHANLYLYVDVLGPDGLRRVDTLHYRLATDGGDWVGKGFGGEWELLLPYASGARFARGGDYLVRVRHGMRYDTLAGVNSLGLRVRRVSNEVQDGEE